MKHSTISRSFSKKDGKQTFTLKRVGEEVRIFSNGDKEFRLIEAKVFSTVSEAKHFMNRPNI